MSENKKEISEEFKKDYAIVEILLRLAAIETVLINKGIISDKDLAEQINNSTNQLVEYIKNNLNNDLLESLKSNIKN